MSDAPIKRSHRLFGDPSSWRMERLSGSSRNNRALFGITIEVPVDELVDNGNALQGVKQSFQEFLADIDNTPRLEAYQKEIRRSLKPMCDALGIEAGHILPDHMLIQQILQHFLKIGMQVKEKSK